MDSVYLVLSSLEIRKRALKDQSILQVFLLWKETTDKPSKVATAKKRFSPECVCYWWILLRYVFCSMRLLEDNSFL